MLSAGAGLGWERWGGRGRGQVPEGCGSLVGFICLGFGGVVDMFRSGSRGKVLMLHVLGWIHFGSYRFVSRWVGCLM